MATVEVPASIGVGAASAAIIRWRNTGTGGLSMASWIDVAVPSRPTGELGQLGGLRHRVIPGGGTCGLDQLGVVLEAEPDPIDPDIVTSRRGSRVDDRACCLEVADLDPNTCC